MKLRGRELLDTLLVDFGRTSTTQVGYMSGLCKADVRFQGADADPATFWPRASQPSEVQTVVLTPRSPLTQGSCFRVSLESLH